MFKCWFCVFVSVCESFMLDDVYVKPVHANGLSLFLSLSLSLPPSLALSPVPEIHMLVAGMLSSQQLSISLSLNLCVCTYVCVYIYFCLFFSLVCFFVLFFWYVFLNRRAKAKTGRNCMCSTCLCFQNHKSSMEKCGLRLGDFLLCSPVSRDHCIGKILCTGLFNPCMCTGDHILTLDGSHSWEWWQIIGWMGWKDGKDSRSKWRTAEKQERKWMGQPNLQLLRFQDRRWTYFMKPDLPRPDLGSNP